MRRLDLNDEVVPEHAFRELIYRKEVKTGYRALCGPPLPKLPCNHALALEISIATVGNAWQIGDPPAKRERPPPTESHVCGNILGQQSLWEGV